MKHGKILLANTFCFLLLILKPLSNFLRFIRHRFCFPARPGGRRGQTIAPTNVFRLFQLLFAASDYLAAPDVGDIF
jgi:hypothetical protein